MIDEKVTFEMVFPIEPYRNFKLGYEGSIEPDEIYSEAAIKAFQKVMAAGDKIYAELRLPISSQSSVAPLVSHYVIQKEPEGDEAESAIQEILHCQTIEELETFRVILNTKAAKSFPRIQEAYDTMYQKLSK